MRRAIAILAIQFVVPISTVIAQPQGEPVDLDDSLAVLVVNAMNRNQFNMADQTISSQLAKDSTSLEWLFLRGIRSYASLIKFPGIDQRALANMKQDMERTTELGEQRLKQNPNDRYTLFYTGGAYGYLGIAKAAAGSLFGAVGTAKKGFNMHDDLIGQCPECYDAYLGPGMMNLMTSDAPWILKPILWVFGLSGSEQRACDYLSIAFQKGKLVRLEAGTYLAQLYDRRKEHAKAFEIYSQLVQEYPMRIVLRAEALSPLWADHRYDDIIATARSTMDIFKSRQYSFTAADSAMLPSIVVSYSRANRLKGDIDYAISILVDFIHNEDYHSIDKAEVYSCLAGSYLIRKDTVRAVETYKAILSSDATDDDKKNAQKALNKIYSSQ